MPGGLVHPHQEPVRDGPLAALADGLVLALRPCNGRRRRQAPALAPLGPAPSPDPTRPRSPVSVPGIAVRPAQPVGNTELDGCRRFRAPHMPTRQSRAPHG